MRNGSQFVGAILATFGVAVTLRGVFEADSVPMIVLGACAAAAGFGLIFRGHYQGR